MDSQIEKGLIREEISVIIALRCIVVSAVDFMSLNLCLNGTRFCAFLLPSRPRLVGPQFGATGFHGGTVDSKRSSRKVQPNCAISF